MYIKRKPYKAIEPEITISNIRNIIFNKLGLLLKERNYVCDGLYSCRVSIQNKNVGNLNIGTNGKGLSYKFALASAYGEFMERLQNYMLIFHLHFANDDFLSKIKMSDFSLELKKRKISLSFNLAPDEVVLESNKIREINKIEKLMRPKSKLTDFFDGREITLVPYYSVSEDKIEYLPADMIFTTCTSNGMCAGNVPKEAILQGLSEILERYILRRIYKDNLSFPSIPKEYFDGYAVLDILSKLEKKYNAQFIVKDCSLGIGIPAVGVLVIDSERKKYNFHLGVDPSIITALERTLTEMAQGRFMLEMLSIDIDYQSQIEKDSHIKEYEFNKSYTKGVGHYPLSILSKDSSFSFKGVDLRYGQSDDNDMSLMINLFRDLDSDVYIRDVSFLGFPAYSIYVPGLSESRGQFSDGDISKDFPYRFSTAINIENSSLKDIEKLALFLEANPTKLSFFNIYNNENYISKYPIEVVLVFLNLIVRKYDKVVENIQKAIVLKNRAIDISVLECIRGIILKRPIDLLLQLYTKEIYDESLDFIKNPIKMLSTSTCFECSICNIRSSCNLFDIIEILKNMENEYIKNTPNQKKLREIFKDFRQN